MMRVGTSGWSYDDWAGEFYPPGLGKERWLEYYARFFHTTEINSTYYAFPSPAIVQGWISRASKLVSFEYSLKMPKLVTHDSLLLDIGHALSFESHVMSPMQDAGCMGAALIQLSPYFILSENTGHLGRLRSLLERLDTSRFEYAVEFRHASWLDGDGLAGEAIDLLSSKGVAVCAVDGPSMPPIVADIAGHAYVRFHGRNADLWFKKGVKDERMNRYDYCYTKDELEPWKARIEPLKARTVRAYFNNHPHANAVKNAKLFESLAGIDSEPLPKIEKQSSLSSYF